jgi:exopolysaccharide production protein ExoZ
MGSESKPARRPEIVGIQYLRGIAALLVLIVHSDHMLRQEKYFGIPYIGDFSNGGNLGVDLFFVISGFIMFHITDGFSPATDSRKFVRRRFVRIIPFLWLSIISVFVLRTLVRGGIDVVPFVRAFFLWPVGDVDPNPVWTLRHELFFYICTFCCLAFRRGALVLAAFLLLPIPIWFLKSQVGFLNMELISNIFNVQANTSFAMGILLGWLFQKQRVLSNHWIGSAAVIASPVLLMCFEYFIAPVVGPGVMKCVLTTLICGVIVYASLGCIPTQSIAHRIGMLLGNASYSIYLSHETVISFTGILFVKMKWLNHGAVAGVLSVMLALLFGILVHFIIEKPMIKMMRKWVGD